MSQISSLGGGGGPAAGVSSLRGNDGISVLPIANNIDVIGNQGILFDGTTPGTLNLSFQYLNIVGVPSPGTGDLQFQGQGYLRPGNGVANLGDINLGPNSGNYVGVDTQNINIGYGAGTRGTTSNLNINIGFEAGVGLTTGTQNIFLGPYAGGFVVGNSITGSGNIGLGLSSLLQLTTGISNVALGPNSGGNITTGSYHIALGESSGPTTGALESTITIFGSATTSNTMILGFGSGTGSGELVRTIIHGIFGATIGAAVSGVIIDATGRLGTIVSSRRYKDNIVELTSSRVLELQPVAFNYISTGDASIGLIAEDVELIMPSLVVRNLANQVETVKYHDIPVLLLAEIKKLRAEMDLVKAKLA